MPSNSDSGAHHRQCMRAEGKARGRSTNCESTGQVSGEPGRARLHIRDISDTGVRLVVPGGLASDQFTIFDRDVVERRCVVIWRIGELVRCRKVDDDVSPPFRNDRSRLIDRASAAFDLPSMADVASRRINRPGWPGALPAPPCPYGHCFKKFRLPHRLALSGFINFPSPRFGWASSATLLRTILQYSLVPQSLDLIFQHQFSTLEFGELQIIGRTMLQCFGKLVFEIPMLLLKFRKMHCCHDVHRFVLSDFNAFHTLD